MKSVKSAVVLVGPPGVGKTTVGRVLAERLGVRWVDADDEVERRHGRPIDEIFRVEGEAEFRRLESESLRGWLSSCEDGGVYSAGGGILESPENLALLLGETVVVYLTAKQGTLCDRILKELRSTVGSRRVRPLLEGDSNSEERVSYRIAELVSRRAKQFEQCHLRVWTDFCDEQGISLAIAQWLSSNPESAQAALVPIQGEPGGRVSAVYIPADGSFEIGRFVRLLAGRSSVAVVSDENVEKFHGASLIDEGKSVYRGHYLIQSGEGGKKLSAVEDVGEKMLQAGFERSTVLVGFGGGVVGDVTGLLASLYMRGTRFIQVPTTLLAQVDSSVGGKTAVNLPSGKNSLGTFYPAEAVICDIRLLQSLPERDYRSGLAEVVKYGVISSEKFFCWLEENRERLLARDDETLRFAIEQSVLLKAEAIFGDQEDRTGRRAVLNFGHTVGHAIERLTNYSQVLHGEGVSIGMVTALQVGERLGVTDHDVKPRVERLLREFGLPVQVSDLRGQTDISYSAKSWKQLQQATREEWTKALGADKKMVSERLGYIVAERLGVAKVLPLRVEYVLDTLLSKRGGVESIR